MRLLSMLFILATISSCDTTVEPQETIVEKINTLKAGTWVVNCEINDSIAIPFRMEIDENQKFTIVNHKERIVIDDATINGDSIKIKMPRFDSEFVGTLINDKSFSGLWYNYLKSDYSIPFEANFIQNELLGLSNGDHSLKYNVTFSPGLEDEYKAIGLFHSGTSYSYGTFITETGDYRFLEGNINDSRLSLSCFDGSHLFLFTADIVGDQIINGNFYSGKHWYEPWIASHQEEVELRNPDSLTYLVDGQSTIEFSAKNYSGEDIAFSREDYLNKVSIVQIFGSWCPNCYDENKFYKELFESHKNDGFQIIPIAFEKGEDFNQHVKYVSNHFNNLEMPYPSFIGGVANKSQTSEKFSMLNAIISYPTSIFIDKKGEVRKIHTGFYGPGTGEYYTDYVMKTKAFVEELLEE